MSSTDPESPRRVTPSAARRRLGDELRSVRDRAGLTLADAAAKIQRSAPTLSRLETGKATPRAVDVRALLEYYEDVDPGSVPDRLRDELLQLADNGREDEWFTSFRDVLSSDMTRDDMQRYVAYEADATEIRSYEPDLVPGLLQTRPYAAAVVERFFPDRTERERARLVDFRMARQEVLRRPPEPLRFRVVIGELVVRRVVSSVKVMEDQLRHLLDEIGNGTAGVEIFIVPMTLSVPAALGGPFVVIELPGGEPEVVYLESREGAQYRQDAATRRRYDGHFNVLLESALDEQEATRLVEEAIKALG